VQSNNGGQNFDPSTNTSNGSIPVQGHQAEDSLERDIDLDEGMMFRNSGIYA
jgi:hypothetical protein